MELHISGSFFIPSFPGRFVLQKWLLIFFIINRYEMGRRIYVEILRILLTYSTIPAGIIAVLLVYFNKEHNKYEENTDKYYNKLLKPFFNQYLNNKDIDISDFNEDNERNCEVQDYLPPYIYFLIESKQLDKLKKILIVDYLGYYPSLKNIILRSCNNIFRRLNFITYFFFLVAIPIIIDILIMFFLQFLITDFTFDNNLIIVIIYLLVMLGLILLFLFFYIKNGIYTYETTAINKRIESKEKEYRKLSKKIYFLDEVKTKNRKCIFNFWTK